MSLPTILIIEPDLQFSQKLANKLHAFGFKTILRTNIQDPEELFKLKTSIQSIVLNLELKNIEGLTLYSYIKNHKLFKNTTFTFLADDQNIFCLLENMPLERSIVVSKKIDFQEIIQKIINNISLFSISQTQFTHYTEATGRFYEISLDEVLKFCNITAFTGILFINRTEEIAILEFHLGKLQNIFYKNLPIDEALQELKSWTDGEFRLERQCYSVDEIKRLLSTHLNDNSVSMVNISINDLFYDLFYFLHNFLQDQMPEKLVISIFEKNINEFLNNNPQFIGFDYFPHTDEKVLFNLELTKDDIQPLINLFTNIFLSSKSNINEIDYHDLLDYLHEIEPYLRQIDFYKYFLENLPLDAFKITSSESNSINNELSTFLS